MTPHDVLEKYLDFREFLDAQEEVITVIAGGADALVVIRRKVVAMYSFFQYDLVPGPS